MDKVKSLSALGGKVNATVTWEEQNTALRDMGQMLKQKLADIKAENPRARDFPILEGRMSCQLQSSGATSGSWQFGFNGQMRLRFDSDNRRWTEVHPGSNWMKEKWEKDREVTEFLHRSSKGDCRAWLVKFLEHWKAELEPTGNWQEGRRWWLTSYEMLLLACVPACVSVCVHDPSTVSQA
ncbi:NKG2D ligand 1 [Sciurus carolinensis]|uniref:NKG2D ligand 1 n=1 Tax=Sciurus carolinensis TaxID=30640 RepID=A0AA41MSV6_SCICA|nr:NKG2D ligand 1 [Sciurus carolinensis]